MIDVSCTIRCVTHYLQHTSVCVSLGLFVGGATGTDRLSTLRCMQCELKEKTTTIYTSITWQKEDNTDD